MLFGVAYQRGAGQPAESYTAQVPAEWRREERRRRRGARARAAEAAERRLQALRDVVASVGVMAAGLVVGALLDRLRELAESWPAGRSFISSPAPAEALLGCIAQLSLTAGVAMIIVGAINLLHGRAGERMVVRGCVLLGLAGAFALCLVASSDPFGHASPCCYGRC